MLKNKVFILKAPSDDNTVDPYQDELVNAGFQVSLIPVIQFNFVRTSELIEKLKHPMGYSGIVFTSKRAVEAVKIACPDNDNDILNSWKDAPVYVVGQATSDAVKSLLGLNSLGEQAGSAGALSTYIIENTKTPGKLLFPRGNLAKDTLEHVLESHNISLDHIVVYETETNKELEKILEKEGLPEWMILFSPSGARSSLPLMKGIHSESLSSVKIVAIGPTTKKEIEDLGYTVFRTASNPSPEAVKKALLLD